MSPAERLARAAAQRRAKRAAQHAAAAVAAVPERAGEKLSAAERVRSAPSTGTRDKIERPFRTPSYGRPENPETTRALAAATALPWDSDPD